MSDSSAYPQNIAIIMDGNGRWAAERGLSRPDGHKEGIKSVDAIITAAVELGLTSLVLYAFSTENWKRPQAEITVLMAFLSEYLDKELKRLKEQNIRFNVIGRIADFDTSLRAKIARNIEETKNNSGLRLVLALSYGGRAEIIDAVQTIARKVAQGSLKPEAVTEESFKQYLYLPDLPDPDLLIRTSGEMRISNFLLWQLSYSEMYVTKTLWPDFRKEQFVEALNEYTKRQRRFGR